MRKKKRLQIMCSIVVKRMQQEDLPAVCEIEKDNFSIPWSEKSFLDSMERSDTVFLTAFADGEVAGYLGCYCVAGEGEITNVAVKDSCRRRGIGGQPLDSIPDMGSPKKEFVKIFTKSR